MKHDLYDRLARLQTPLLVIGLVALAASLIGAFTTTKQFFFSYLFSCLFWLGLSLGCFMVSMIHQLTGGRWGYPTRRILEAGSMALPLMLLLFIPVCFGLKHLYPWARATEVATDQILQQRHAYQNSPGYIIRAAFCFAIWIWMIWRLRKWSLQQDATPSPEPTRKARALSGIGIVVYSLMGTF